MRLGVLNSVVFGGFASKELATRIDDAKRKVVTFPDGTVRTPLVDRDLELLDECLHVVDVIVRDEAEALIRKLTTQRASSWPFRSAR